MKEAAALPRGGRHKAPLRPLPAMDLPFLILVLTLVGFGLVMLYSASSAVALYRRGDAWAYVRPQLLYAAMGIGAMWAASRVDYHIYHKLAWPLLALSLVLLVVVLFMPEYNGCKRWLVLPGLGTLQPSEIAKFAVVLVFAHIIALNHDRMGSFAVGVLPFALVLGAVAVLMLLEPHLSGTVLILHPGIGSIELGEPLTTPDPEIALRIYYAQAGEELFGIARRFHVSPAQILTANGLEAGTQVLPQAMHFLVPGA